MSTKLSGKAGQVLDAYIDKWGCVEKRTPNPNIAMAIERGVTRLEWREFYQRRAAWTMRMIHSNTLAVMPLELEMEERDELEKFMEVLLANFQAASATNLDALTNFKPDPKESLNMLVTTFNLIFYVSKLFDTLS